MPPIPTLSERSFGKLSRGRYKILSLVFFIAIASFHASSLWAEEDAEEKPTFWTRETLSGDWGGVRKKLSEKGIDFEFTYTGDVMANVAGGIQRQADYLDNTDMILSIDAEKLVGWKGASFYFYGLENQGGSPSANSGDVQGVDNIESPDAWKLYEAWYQQRLFDNRFSFLLGLYDTNSEFDSMETASLFINASFGMGPDFSQSGLNGPSTLPATSLAARFRFEPKKWLYLQTAVLDGVAGDPAHPNSTQVKFADGDGLLFISEIGLLPGGFAEGARYGKFAIGHWIYTSDFDDLADVDAAGDPIRRSGNSGFYLLGEYNVYREKEDQGLSVFARFGYANPSINPINYYFGFGGVYTGLIPKRDADKLGLGIATAVNGSPFVDGQAAGGTLLGSLESTIELTYNAQVFPWFSLQPDLQYIINPGMDPSLDNALQFGLRFSIGI